jgi:hypothetical protein
VRRIILNLYVDRHRRRGRWRRSAPKLLDEPDYRIEATAVLRHDLASALRGLAPRQRACLVARYLDDLTVPQIAALGMTTEEGVELRLTGVAVKPDVVAVMEPAPDGGATARHERVLHVKITVVADRDIELRVDHQLGGIALLDRAGRVLAAGPNNTMKGLSLSTALLTASVPRAAFGDRLASCDPEDPGVPEDARYVRIGPGSGTPPWLVGTWRLP